MSITLPSLGNNMILQIDTSINIILGTSTYKHKWKMIKDKWKMIKHKWKLIKHKWKLIKHKWKMIKHKGKMVRKRLNLNYLEVMALKNEKE